MDAIKMIYVFIIYLLETFPSELKIKGILAAMEAIPKMENLMIFNQQLHVWENSLKPMKTYIIMPYMELSLIHTLVKSGVYYFDFGDVIVTIPTEKVLFR